MTVVDEFYQKLSQVSFGNRSNIFPCSRYGLQLFLLDFDKKMKRSGWFKQCVLSTVLPRGSVRGERRAVGKMFLKRNRYFTQRRWRAPSSLEIMRFYQSFVKRESWELRGSPTWTTTACWMRQKVEAKVITWIFIRCTMQICRILLVLYWLVDIEEWIMVRIMWDQPEPPGKGSGLGNEREEDEFSLASAVSIREVAYQV